MNKYNFELDLDSENSLSLIIDMIKPNSKILEFGPANGRLTRHLKENMNCLVDIVEIDEISGKDASKFANLSFIGKEEGNIENYIWFEKLKHERYDYIVFADVLEHLYDPIKVLKKSNQILKDKGSILLSIPNIAHNSIIIDLINDEFKYDKTGLLDYTHIRFFTYNSLKRMIYEAGLSVVQEKAVYSKVGENEILNSYKSIDSNIEKELRQRENGNIYQFIFNIKKEFTNIEHEYLKPKILDRYQTLCYIKTKEMKNYSNEKIIKETIKSDSVKQIFNLSKYSNIDEITIIPITTNCIIKINNIFAINNNEKIKLEVSRTNSNNKFDSIYLFKSTNPEIYINLKGLKVESIILDYEILEYNFKNIEKISNVWKNIELYYDNLNNNINSSLLINQEELKSCKKELELYKKELESYKKELESYKKELESYKKELEPCKKELEKIYNSFGWKILTKIYNFRDFIFPQNSKRRFLMKLIKKVIKNPKIYINSLNKDNIKKLKYYIKNEDLCRVEDRLNCFDEKHTDIQVNKIKITEVEEGIYENIVFEKFNEPLVSIIIPVYNQWNYTYSCLKSIKENTKGISYEIIIADDVSTDLTKDIKSYIKNINVIRNEKNLGFLLNCNNAAKHARGKYIHFLNNDTNVQEEWLSSLVELIEKDKTIGMVGSKLVYSNGQLQEAGGIIWNDASGWNYGRLDDPSKSEYNYVKEVDYISGASIMISKKLWDCIGGFDERYAPAYFEDSDLAFEVRKAGYKVVYQPKSVVVHFEGISHGTDENTGIKSYQVKNKEKFIEKWKYVLKKDHFNNAENVFLARDKSKNKETVVVVDHYVPHYDKDAGSRTTYQYLNLLVDMGFNVKFIGDNFFKHEPYTSTLQQNGIEVLYGEYYHKNWLKWIKENNEYIDYAFLHRPHITTKYIDDIKKYTNAKIIYYVHDIHYLREMREYELTGNKDTLKLSNEWKKKELDIMSKSDAVLTPSIDEKIIIGKEIGDKKSFATPIFYYKEFNELEIDVNLKKDLLFVGGFGHKPNEDGVMWFINNVWPLVIKKLPDVKFRIVGSNPTEKIKSLANENIIVTGFVSDEELLEYYRKSRISIIPLRYGAGVKGKTIEAMYNKSAIVSTSIGIEGLEGINDYIIGYDKPEEFANEIISLYNDEKRLQDMPSRYNKYLKQYFSHSGAIQLFKTIFTK